MKKIVFVLALFSSCSLPLFAQNFGGRSSSDVRVLSPYKFCVGEDDGNDACISQSGKGQAKFSGNLNLKQLGGSCSADSNNTFASAVACAASSGYIHAFTSLSSYSLTANTTIPAGVTLQMDNGAILNCNGNTLTINAPIVADASQHFQNCTGTQLTLGPLAIANTYAEWFGISTSNSAASNDTGLTMAVNAVCAGTAGDGFQNFGTILFGAGTYQHSAQIDSKNGGCIWRGAGEKATQIQCTSCAGVDQFVTGYWVTVEKLVFTNSGTAVSAIALRGAHIKVRDVNYSPTTANYSDSYIRQQQNAVSGIYDVQIERVQINFNSSSTMPKCINLVNGGGGNAAVNVVMKNIQCYAATTTAYDIGASSGPAPAGIECDQCYSASYGALGGTFTAWHIGNGAAIHIHDSVLQLCGDSSTTCNTHKALVCDKVLGMEINGVQFDGGGHAHGIQSTSNNCADVDVHNNSWRSINPWDQSGFAICDALIDLSGGSYNWHIKGDSSMATAGNRLACYPSSANNPAINNGGSAYNSETWGPVDTPEFFTWGMTPMAVGSVNIGPATNLFLCYYDSTAYRAKCSQGTNAAAGSFDTLVFASTTDTLANKTLSSPVIGPASTVASLPTCNAGAQDQIRIVTDANAPTYNATVAGGGAVRIPVYCNGSNWVSH